MNGVRQRGQEWIEGWIVKDEEEEEGMKVTTRTLLVALGGAGEVGRQRRVENGSHIFFNWIFKKINNDMTSI